MKERTLVTHRRYFGVDPMYFRAAAGRVVSRIVGLPPARAQVTASDVAHDFGATTLIGREIVDSLVAEGLLRPRTGRPDEYRVTPLFHEFAVARVVDPLPRSRAKLLLDDACALASRINRQNGWNPLEIAALAVYGEYMSRQHRLGELSLGVVVRMRTASRRTAFRRALTKSEGADELRAAFRGLTSFINVRLVTDPQTLPRPFAIAWQAEPADS